MNPALRIPRAAYRARVARANLENAARRQHEPERFATAVAWFGERLPRCWRTDLEHAGASDLDV